jgi:hypothetical protein
LFYAVLRVLLALVYLLTTNIRFSVD